MTTLRKSILILLKEDILELSNPNTRFLYMALFKTIYMLLVASMNYNLSHYSLKYSIFWYFFMFGQPTQTDPTEFEASIFFLNNTIKKESGID